MMPFIVPDWPEIPGVKAVATTRLGGVSVDAYKGLNLGDHVQDAADAVRANRQLLTSDLGLPPDSVQWLCQVHGISVHRLENVSAEAPVADAVCTDRQQRVCAVMTADCLPVLLASKDGCRVAAAHAGWRGLQQGILEQTLGCFSDPAKVQAWLGPAIGPASFEVGDEVKAAFVDKTAGLNACFEAAGNGKWMADIYGLARKILDRAGVTEIYGGDFCTFQDSQRFFSFRRDGLTGRMASLIWKS